MLPDLWIEKAWEIHRQAQCFPTGTIVKAAVWLEERDRQAPQWQTAIVIALHYLVLAIREEGQAHADMAEEYLFRAVRWREAAILRLNEICSLIMRHA